MKNTKPTTNNGAPEAPESVSLAFNDIGRGGTSDKVYHLSLSRNCHGFTVAAQYGRRGGALATDCKTKNGALPYSEAREIFDRVLREKLNKGYINTGAQAPVAQIEPPPLGGICSRCGAHNRIVNECCCDKDNLPTRVFAQELLEEITEDQLARFISSPDYWMQDKSDGQSRGAVKADGAIFGLNKLGKRVPLPAALHEELSRIPLATFQIDAELVGDKLICRDLLNADRDLSGLSYLDRFCFLVSLLDPKSKLIAAVETWEGEKNKAAALARSYEEHREGVVFKLKSAPHRVGRNGQHKKFKFVKTLSAIAGKPRAKGKDSVEIFLIDGKAKVRIGTVSLIGKPQVREGDVLEIRYLYAYPSKLIVQARLERIRTDVEQRECTTAQLIYKREEAA